MPPIKFSAKDIDAPGEVTLLSSAEETKFKQWAKTNQITDVDAPESRYDYRGYWKDVAAKGADQRKTYDDGPHFPDTYKQHGHPTFSVESKYSSGPGDGGSWDGETFVPPSSKPLKFSTADIDSSKGDIYKGPSTWSEGFSESVKDTAARTAKSILKGAAAVVNPMTYVRGYDAKKAAEAQMVREIETGEQRPRYDVGAALELLTTPEGGGEAIGNLIAGGVLPKVPGVVGRVAGKVDAGAAVRAAKTGMDLVRHPIRTVVGAVVDEAARRMGPTAEVRAIANPAPAAVAEAAPVVAKAAPVVADAVPILDEAGRPLGGTTVPEATVGAQKPKYAGPERRLTPDEQVRQDLRSDPSAGRKADAERFKVNAARTEAEAARAENVVDFKPAKAVNDLVKRAKAEPTKVTLTGKEMLAGKDLMAKGLTANQAFETLVIRRGLPAVDAAAIAPKVFNELAIAAKQAKTKLSPADFKALSEAVQQGGISPTEAVSTLVQQRLASKLPGVMSNAQVDAEIAARVGNRSPS